jgi:hypothetical protein
MLLKHARLPISPRSGFQLTFSELTRGTVMNRRTAITSVIAAAMSRFVQADVGLSDQTLSIHLNTSPFDNTLRSLSETLELRGEISQRLLDLLEFPDQLFRLESDHLAAGAYKLIVRLYPSDAFLAAIAAG